MPLPIPGEVHGLAALHCQSRYAAYLIAIRDAAVTLNLADQFRLNVYDAAYLELARRRILPLATLDQELRTAATAIGVTVLGS